MKRCYLDMLELREFWREAMTQADSELNASLSKTARLNMELAHSLAMDIGSRYNILQTRLHV